MPVAPPDREAGRPPDPVSGGARQPRPSRAARSSRSPFAYAIVRVVPRVERGEWFNAGVVLFCRPRRFLRALVQLDETVLRALAPDCDPAAVRAHLDAIVRIAAGEADAGPIARLPPHERFHWLVAPSSTIIQRSEVHTGLTADPEAMLEHLFRTLVLDRGALASSAEGLEGR